MSRFLLGNNKLLDAAAAAAHSLPLNVASYQHVTLEVVTTGSANLVAKVKVSNQETVPDFTAASTPSNRWSYAQMKDYNDNSSVNGTDGIAPTGTDISKLYEVNTNYVRWICAQLVSRVAGAITVVADAANDNVAGD